MNVRSTILGMFETPHEAQLTIQALKDYGIPEGDISLLMPYSEEDNRDTSELSDVNKVEQDSIRKGLGAGAAAGGALGLLAGLGAFTIPGLGPILAAGPIVALLEGMGFGAIAGGLAGALAGEGVPNKEIEFYTDGLKSGHALVIIETEDDLVGKVYEILENHGAIETAEPGPPASLDHRSDHQGPRSDLRT
jgi:hypothetical protein